MKSGHFVLKKFLNSERDWIKLLDRMGGNV